MSLTPTVFGLGYNGNNRIQLYQYTMTSVALSSTGSEETLANLPSVGIIKQIKASCASTDFDLSIKNKSGGSADTVNEIFRCETNNKHYDESDLNINYKNADTTLTTSLYAKVKNDDGSNATGSISLEIFVEVLDSI